jgi:hypothetical protein
MALRLRSPARWPIHHPDEAGRREFPALIDGVADAMTAGSSMKRHAGSVQQPHEETPEQSSDGAPKLLNQKKK